MGYIYILHNVLFGDNMYKIGFTQDLYARMSQYNTSFPINCEYVYTKEVSNNEMRMYEKDVHTKLKEFRIENKEFFNITLDNAIECIESFSCSLSIVNNESNETNITCKYCSKLFKSNWNLKNHLKTCKMQTDQVRLLELELGFDTILDVCINQCRFCKFQFNMICSYQRHMRSGCKDKEEYREQLEEMLKEKNAPKNVYNMYIENMNIKL